MSSRIAIIGAGYVGLPLAVAFAEAGRSVHLVDVDEAKVKAIGRGESYIEDVPSAEVAELSGSGRLTAGTDFADIAGCDAIVICVPTPLSANREPDLQILEAATRAIAPH